MSKNNSEEKDLLLDHEYDGIKELDHPLPYWWSMSFFLCILFSIPYFILYVWGGAPSLAEEHAQKMARIKEIRAQFAANNVDFVPDEYQIHNTPEGQLNGKIVYDDNCLSCHGDDGRGDIGPNLTDQYWLYADGSAESVYQIAFKGVEENGMPPWGEILSKEEIYQAVSYIMTLKNTNVEGGKEPQGNLIE